MFATRNKCIATSNKCLTSSNKKLLETISIVPSDLVYNLWDCPATQGVLRVTRHRGFVDGCMAIKGSATALDMQKQLYYIQELSRTLQTWERILEADRR